MTLGDWKDLSEILKNLVEALAVFGAAWGVLLWLYQRRDRAADVLFELETRFAVEKLVDARAQLEDGLRYQNLAQVMARSVEAKKNKVSLGNDEAILLGNIDELLRFYVLLLGIRRARQVPDVSLRTCYRYWLGLYRDSRYTAFKDYVDSYFRTLSQWLREDAARPRGKKFFDYKYD